MNVIFLQKLLSMIICGIILTMNYSAPLNVRVAHGQFSFKDGASFNQLGFNSPTLWVA